MHKWDVIVIGAGFAGLSCATALADAGARVLALEARPTLGGRATAFRDPQTGERIDNGQHVLAGCYDETRKFLRRLGTEARLHRPSGLRVPMVDETGRYTVLDLPPLPAPLHLLGGVLAWDALSWSERVSILRLGRPLRRISMNGGPVVPPEHETVRLWLERHGQSPRLCRLLWEPLALAALNQSIDRASASSFLSVIGRMFGTNPEAASLLLPAVPLDELYAEPARRYLQERGSAVRTNAPARVRVTGGRVADVIVRDAPVSAPVVVSTVAWHAFSTLFDAAPPPLETLIAAAARLHSSPIVTANVWLDRDVLPDDLLGLPGRTFQWVFDKRRLLGTGATHLSMVSSGAEETLEMTTETAVATALVELIDAVPAARQATVRRASIVRERHATFSLAPSMPPRPGTETPVAGLLLAGDWIDTGLPATIESAVVSGHVAAAAAVRLLGR